jgi:hypothetical protein
LAAAINQLLSSRALSQTEAARRLGVNQPKVSALRNCKLEGFSVERLMQAAVRGSFRHRWKPTACSRERLELGRKYLCLCDSPADNGEQQHGLEWLRPRYSAR